MENDQRRLHVLGAFVCDEARRRRDGGTDYVGSRDYLQLPRSGPLRLKGHLAVKLCRALVISETSIGVPASSLGVDLRVRFVGPSGEIAPPTQRRVNFNASESIARELVGLDGLEVREIGFHALEVSVDGQVLTAVPVMVVPFGTIEALTTKGRPN